MKKKLLLINSVCGIRSTGRICVDIAREFEAKGWEVKIAYGREPYVPQECRKWAVRIGTKIEVYIHALLARLWGDHAFGVFRSTYATKRFIKWAEEWNPDAIWLHNLHGYYINAELLFGWIKSRNFEVVKWTLHDCWAFTGGCGYFTSVNCQKWHERCQKCPRDAAIVKRSIFGAQSETVFKRKRKAFAGVKGLKLVTPSKWLADLTRQSFLACYDVEVANNKIDKSIFCHRESDFRNINGLLNKYVILGVACPWSERKGLLDFIRLSALLPDGYCIVLVGVNEKQIRHLPINIVGIKRTESAIQLAEIYSAADIFFNPTKEENYPTVNLEAVACGCKVVTYDTGGAAETVAGVVGSAVLFGSEKSPEGFLRYMRREGLLCD
jgi:glycosyltransferase involved in cell wall biosynthesis